MIVKLLDRGLEGSIRDRTEKTFSSSVADHNPIRFPSLLNLLQMWLCLLNITLILALWKCNRNELQLRNTLQFFLASTWSAAVVNMSRILIAVLFVYWVIMPECANYGILETGSKEKKKRITREGFHIIDPNGTKWDRGPSLFQFCLNKADRPWCRLPQHLSSLSATARIDTQRLNISLWVPQ